MSETNKERVDSMQVKTIEEARALVGRTFERDGIAKVFTGFTSFEGRVVDVHFEIVQQSRLDKANDWLSGATEVTEVHDA